MQETNTSPTLTDLLSMPLHNKGSDLRLQPEDVPIGRINIDLDCFEMPALAEEPARSRHSREFVRF